LTMTDLVLQDRIESKILLIRGKKTMLDRDLAALYEVKTGVLNQAVKRNADRFPDDFMFQLNADEFDILKSQIVISSWGGIRKPPYAFTELGVAMLSSVLNSTKAIQVNIQIMRTFLKLRQILATHEELRRKIDGMERKYDQQFKIVFDAIKSLIEPRVSPHPERKIGFQPPTGTKAK
jgi:hypothetical protein